MYEDEDQDLIMNPVDTPEWQNWAVQIAQIIASAWIDDEFKKALLEHPAEMLREHGLCVPDDMEVVVVEGATEWRMSGPGLAAATRFEIPLPPKPAADDLLAAWATGDPGHPPVLGEDGQVAFAGMSDVAYEDGGAMAVARRIAARRIVARRVIGEDDEEEAVAGVPRAARRVAARRVVARRIVARRISARRVAARRTEEEGTGDGTGEAKKSPAKGKKTKK